MIAEALGPTAGYMLLLTMLCIASVVGSMAFCETALWWRAWRDARDRKIRLTRKR